MGCDTAFCYKFAANYMKLTRFQTRVAIRMYHNIFLVALVPGQLVILIINLLNQKKK